MKFCKNCGKQISDTVAFCSYCGANAIERGSARVCAVCGAYLEAGQLFCENCGTSCLQDGHAQITAQRLTLARKHQTIVGTIWDLVLSVDGKDLGTLPNGGSFSTEIFSDTIQVGLRATNHLYRTHPKPLRLCLKVKVEQGQEARLLVHMTSGMTRYKIMVKEMQGVTILTQETLNL